jgi:hypothetical protein
MKAKQVLGLPVIAKMPELPTPTIPKALEIPETMRRFQVSPSLMKFLVSWMAVITFMKMRQSGRTESVYLQELRAVLEYKNLAYSTWRPQANVPCEFWG